MSKFQAIVLGIFIVCILTGVALFATYKAGNQTTALSPVTIWGTLPQSYVVDLVQTINASRTTPIVVNYVEKSNTTFDQDFIETLARGQGPDAILLSQEHILRHFDKIIPIPFTTLSERDFRNTYIPQAELYITPAGTLALPFTIDPLVMYWNRDIFTSAGIATYPKYWDEFIKLASLIDEKDVNSNIRRSVVALGEFSNITHAREVLSALLLQAGNPITRISTDGVQSTLGEGKFSGTASSKPAVEFFTQFSNPQSPFYSWNRSLPSSRSWFLSGNLATYFGFASELLALRSKNPNIDFDVAPFPQIKNTKSRVTYGTMYGFSIVRSSKDPSSTYTVINILTDSSALQTLSKSLYLPPVRRDMIATDTTDLYQKIFYDSALISRGWLDGNVNASTKIFQNMVESITSGRVDLYNAIQTAHEQLNQVLGQ